MGFRRAKRLDALPPYLFVEIDRKKREAIAAGKDVIDLGVGDPDKPTPKFIIDRMARAIEDPRNHRYPFDEGVPAFREQAAEWLATRYDVRVDPNKEVIAAIGTKEAIGHLPLAIVDPGDYVLVPQPGYPVYQTATLLAGGIPYHVDLTEANNWLPDLAAIPEDVRRATSLLYLNYPNNPTAAIAPRDFYEGAVAFARKYGILIAQDAAYNEVFYEQRPASILQIDGAKEVAIEFHSLSKTFNMTGWRIGFVAGNGDAIAALAKVKANLDSGQFNAIQWAGAEALANGDRVEVRAQQDIYRERRDILVDGLRQAGFRVRKPAATFYVWVACPDGWDSMALAGKLLEEVSVVAIPGVGFGKPGEGYLRAGLTLDTERIKEAVDRISRVTL